MSYRTALTTGLALAAVVGASALLLTSQVQHTPVVQQQYTDRPYIAAAPTSQVDLPPCATEDSTECYWNGYRMGNGTGVSYVYMDHVVYYVDGRVEYPECTDDGDYCADSTW